jgi:hypothetical protein
MKMCRRVLGMPPMDRHMLPRLAWLLPLVVILGVTGCVERRMVIIADPYPDAVNAIVYDEKDQPIGGSPVDKPFTYYGKYHFRIVKDGYETLDVDQRVRPPWYEWPGLDFISENLVPWTIRDVRYYRYTLQRKEIRPNLPEQVLQQGELLRAYGKTIGAPAIDPSYVVAPATVLGNPVP